MRIERIALYKKRGELIEVPTLITKLGFSAAYKEATNRMTFNNAIGQEPYDIRVERVSVEVPEDYEFLKAAFPVKIEVGGKPFNLKVVLTEDEEQAVFVERINAIKDEAIQFKRAELAKIG